MLTISELTTFLDWASVLNVAYLCIASLPLIFMRNARVQVGENLETPTLDAFLYQKPKEKGSHMVPCQERIIPRRYSAVPHSNSGSTFHRLTRRKEKKRGEWRGPTDSQSTIL